MHRLGCQWERRRADIYTFNLISYSIRGRNSFSGYGVQGSSSRMGFLYSSCPRHVLDIEYCNCNCCAIPSSPNWADWQLAMDQLNTALSLSMSMSGGTSCCNCYCDCIDDWNTVFPACIAMRTGGVIYSIPGKEFGCLERLFLSKLFLSFKKAHIHNHSSRFLNIFSDHWV